MGDNCLVLGQRVSEWCGHAPVLEEDIAMANVGLDLIGQAKLWLTLAGEAEGRGRSADDLAFLRDGRAFRNSLLVEQPNGDYGQALMRQYLFDAWHVPMLEALCRSRAEPVSEIAHKAVKEAQYHLERSRDLVVRLGDGSDESRARMQNALDALWPFTGDLVRADAMDDQLGSLGLAPDLHDIRSVFESSTGADFSVATLVAPQDAAVRMGGKKGLHTEHLDYLLMELQWLQRAYPNAKW